MRARSRPRAAPCTQPSITTITGTTITTASRSTTAATTIPTTTAARQMATGTSERPVRGRPPCEGRPRSVPPGWAAPEPRDRSAPAELSPRLTVVALRIEDEDLDRHPVGHRVDAAVEGAHLAP